MLLLHKNSHFLTEVIGINSYSLKRSSNRHWSKWGMYSSSSIVNSTNDAAVTSLSYVTSHPFPPIVLPEFTNSLGITEVATKCTTMNLLVLS